MLWAAWCFAHRCGVSLLDGLDNVHNIKQTLAS
jgi:hypothetical protein